MQSTIGREIRRHSTLRPNQTAVLASGFASLSYRELQDLIEGVRVDLRSAGLGAQARIAVELPTGPHAALAIVAIACSAVAIPINPKQTLAEVELCLGTLKPDAVLLLRDIKSVARSFAERQAIPIIDAIPAEEGKLGLKILAARHGTVDATHDDPDPEAPAFILQTSGTTAEPKSIPFSHRNMLAAAERLQAWFNLTPQDRCLSVSPAYYSHGLKVTVLASLLTGGSVAFPADPSNFDSVEWFDELKPTWYSASPTLHRLIFDHVKSKPGARTLNSLRFILSGGAPLPPDLLEGLQDALGVPMVEHYGSSEAAQIATNLPPPGLSKRGTCGIPWPNTVRVVDENGCELAQGERGEILVGGPTLMSGYLNAPELNRVSFIDGWFKTGDIGSLDKDGFLTIHGRSKELINRGGEKIWPTEIDNALMRHPAVAEVAAFAVPHQRLGEDVAAAVVLRRGMTATPVELRKFLIEQLAPFKIPRQIIILDRLPRGTAGKVLRHQLSHSLTNTVAARPSDPGIPMNGGLSLQLREIWERLLNTGPLTIDDDFFEKGGDSLLAAEMLIEVERLIGRKVSGSLLFEATTIRQLVQRLSGAERFERTPLIQLSSSGREAPLFYFHGDYIGGGFYAKRLASLLGSAQPIAVIAPHGLDGESVPRSLEEMAADRLPVIRAVQQKGPFRLAGYCIGGLVAFEAARMLIAAGEDVEMVAVIDPPAVNGLPSVQLFLTILCVLTSIRPLAGPYADRVKGWLWCRVAQIDRLSNMSLSQQWAWTKVRIQHAILACRNLTSLVLRGREPTVADRVVNSSDCQTVSSQLTPLERSWKYSIAMANYFPTPLAVKVVHFSSEYTAKGWRRITPDLEVIQLTHGHEQITKNPNDFAMHLRARLQGEGKETTQIEL